MFTLKTFDDKIVTPAYWLQLTPDGISKGEDDYYWKLINLFSDSRKDLTIRKPI